jgi:hypothetical protein
MPRVKPEGPLLGSSAESRYIGVYRSRMKKGLITPASSRQRREGRDSCTRSMIWRPSKGGSTTMRDSEVLAHLMFGGAREVEQGA